MDRTRSAGLTAAGTSDTPDRPSLIRYINLKLSTMGLPTVGERTETPFAAFAHDLLAHYRQYGRLLADYLCPADQRVMDFLKQAFAPLGDAAPAIRLPNDTFLLDRHGLARELSLPVDGDHFSNDILQSYRVRQGVLHNPKSDRRTTKGVFHIADIGLPVPDDKLAVPLLTYARLLAAALQPPDELMRLPFAAGQQQEVKAWCSLLLRPEVSPAVPGVRERKSMETRFFAPGGVVSNLDFVESIFGNAGDPYLPENDAAADVHHWSGHTGCVILAPHLPGLKKKDLGLPHVDQASDRQKRDGMCWTHPDDIYNDANAFKIALRSPAGVMVTILADNYFGYCKKEVKTQISFAANLGGLAEEEHSGGALAFPNFNLGDTFRLEKKIADLGHNFAQVCELLGGQIDPQPQGYAVDKSDASIIYVHESAVFDVPRQSITWHHGGGEETMKLLPGRVYIHPTGYKLRLKRHPAAPSWRLIGTAADGTFCHKPCTVSGGGKSEISKSITDAIQYGPIYVNDPQADFDWVDRVIGRDYGDRHLPAFAHDYSKRSSRPLLSDQRSVGSVIRLLTPSDEFTDDYNAWLRSIPNHVRAIVFIIKRFYKAEWGQDWRKYFGVDEINGSSGHELKYNGRKLVGSYLRIGFSPEGGWRMYKLRQDFVAAEKVQMEDDISASIVWPGNALPGLPPAFAGRSVKIVDNCELRLFQRPDEAIHPGFDKQTEHDMAQPGLFASNFEPLTDEDARELVEQVVTFDLFTPPMKRTLLGASEADGGYVVCSARPRLVDGKPSKNPRYLQIRPDVSRPRETYIAEIGARLWRRLPPGQPVVVPVAAVLAGRRNNPADKAAGIRALAVYSPIHYQELPELFMDFICSLTGKSPSTTGAGSEGALTKGPFNALRASPDLNNALVSYILTGLGGFSTAAGHIGPEMRVDHDISLLIPEIWCRLRPHEREPDEMIRQGHLEPVADLDYNGRRVLASRLGYRVTSRFVHAHFGRVFDNPPAVFSEKLLRPELQDMESFADGVDNIVEAQQRVARAYLRDGSVDDLCPPLVALIHIMAEGAWEGHDAKSPRVRQMFSKDYLLQSDWYARRLDHQQHNDIALWDRHAAYLQAQLDQPAGQHELGKRKAALGHAQAMRAKVASAEYRASLVGTLGADLLGPYPKP